MAAAGLSPHKGGLQSDESKSIREVRGWRWLVLWLLALLVRGWNRTLRMEIDPESLKNFSKMDEPMAFVLWHNRSFVSTEAFRRYCPRRIVYGLVSASKDGSYMAAFYQMNGIRLVRGSSSKFGREAARELVEVLKDGHDIGITPDGPRGPVYILDPGVLVIARRADVPLALFGVEYASAWRLKNWDRYYIPRPFSRVRLRCALLRPHNPDGSKLTVEQARAVLLAISPDPPDKWTAPVV